VVLPTAKSPAPAARYQAMPRVGPAPLTVAVAFLEGDFTKTITPQILKMNQKRFQFEYSILPICVGTRVEFPNEDDDYHSVFSYSKVRRFDLGRYRKDEAPPGIVFDKIGVVRLFCDIHEHMRGAILVLATPHFVVTRPDGSFKLSGLPVGQFKLKVWIDEKTSLEKAVNLRNNETLQVGILQAAP
jgi:plastocyanin